MLASEVLDRVSASGIRLHIKDGSLVATPKGAVSNELRELIRDHKPALIEALAQDYSPADIKELEHLIAEVARLEDWPTGDVERAQANRLRMAPARVLIVLQAYRAAHKAALESWPIPPAERARIAICELL